MFKKVGLLVFVGSLTSACGGEMNGYTDGEGLNESAPEGEVGLDEEFTQNGEAISFGNACKDAKLTVVMNQFDGGRTKVVRLQYDDLSDGQSRYEDVNNQIMEPSDPDVAWTRDLENTKGDRIGHWRVRFQTWRGSNLWNDERWSAWLTPIEGMGVACQTGTRYTIALPLNP
jgi:hypothetical protein